MNKNINKNRKLLYYYNIIVRDLVHEAVKFVTVFSIFFLRLEYLLCTGYVVMPKAKSSLSRRTSDARRVQNARL